MLPPKTVEYIINTHFSKGRDPETIAIRWNRGYPDRKITVEQVEEVTLKVAKLRKTMSPGESNAAYATGSPVLTVVSKVKAKAKKKAGR